MRDRARLDAATLPGGEERTLLRDSLRGFLETHWAAADAVARSGRSDAVAAIWSRLVEQGLASLGSDPTEGGLREIAIAMEELGRAGCSAPMLGAVLVNVALASDAAPARAAAPLLDRLHSGVARIAWSFGELDPSADAGRIAWAGETVSGTLRFVDAGASATHLVVATSRDGGGFAIVELATPSALVTETRALGSDGWAEVALSNAAAVFVALEGADIADLLRIARVALLARAHGAARRAFEMAVDYAKERRQFGQPIGRFQAIQHKLANNLIALEGVRVTLEHAAEAFDVGAASWRYFAAAAAAFGGPALRQVSLETHHAFGAIGYADEHEAPRPFKRRRGRGAARAGRAFARRGERGPA
jgi:alkylation response protein AidB-like acyl-CoA dehydrogenase